MYILKFIEIIKIKYKNTLKIKSVRNVAKLLYLSNHFYGFRHSTFKL